MSDIAIRVENLSKQYTIAHANGRHDTLRDAMAAFGSRLLSGFRSSDSRNLTPDTQNLTPNPQSLTPNPRSEQFWALKDVSFEVKRGEVIGIIGRNGAGKSTLLKILSRITEPTMGRADIYGRVGSLLEVGTGFHPELTGRENIFLNGAILGMRKDEIKHKFDEIVSFAEVEQFIDTPVKHYSSGMYVRLAFAVAAHLEPEILVLDEVLAVGDGAFQAKCAERMHELIKMGTSILLVSHNLELVNHLCGSAILLSGGRIVKIGMPLDITALYRSSGYDNLLGKSSSDCPGHIAFKEISICDQSRMPQGNFKYGDSILFRLSYQAFQSVDNAVVSLVISAPDGAICVETATSYTRPSPLSIKMGSGVIELLLENLTLTGGVYFVSVAVGDARTHANYDFRSNVCQLSISGPARGRGIFTPLQEWRLGDAEE